jgi:SWI/SNF-related matrix-associated actin-dependent regulator 1 of chromatin subfamily A
MLITFAKPTQHSVWNPSTRLFDRKPGGDERFIAFSNYNEGSILKSAGFRWDKQLRLPSDGPAAPGYWWTSEPAIAARLHKYCDETAAPLVEPFAVARKASREVNVNVELPCPEGLSYLPFQRAGIAYALERPNTLFGDEMGLGKTIQAIGVINASPRPESVLVVCPASLKANWRRELRRWLVHDLTIGIADGKYVPPANVVIVNYDVLYRHTETLLARTWDVLIVDEAHLCKNPAARRTQAVFSVKAKRQLYLTGTPMVNRPGELYPLLKRLDPKRWHSRKEYERRYTVWGNPNGGQNLEELQDILRSSVLVRRLKADVLAELPPKRRTIHELEPDTDELRALVKRSDDLFREVSGGSTDRELAGAFLSLRPGDGAAFEELSRLRHDIGVAKVPYVDEAAREILEGYDKLVIFAHHRDVLTLLHRSLVDDFGAVILTGETPVDERQQLVDRFQNDSRCRVFVASILAAGVGLTLTASNQVLFAELDWVPGNLKQAEDRCHRIGAEGHESIDIRMVALGESLDGRIAELLAEKLQTMERALDRKTAEIQATKTEAPARFAETTRANTRETGPRQRSDDDYRAVGLKGGRAQATAIQYCLQVLAGNDPDRAGERNDIGFNGLDTNIGHSLAEWKGDLTPAQAKLGQRILVKYHRQLSPELHTLATKGEGAEAALASLLT